MGIPKFFRWMDVRYPNLLESADENSLPEIDNFYLDMNGIIHNCSHPNDGDVHFRISEDQMFEDIFSYTSRLFSIIKPKQYFFMAVDGVAPRAKMNQQRGRRFRTAKEAHDREEAALVKGDILPDEQRFDSNCITPGTTFMVKLHKAFKEFITIKLSTDPEWQKVKVILSGHETPGEGEHKIMDFIRYQRSQPDYNPNTSHCLYGLDTDLIMLGLSLHDPNFMLLREEMRYTGKRNDATRCKSHRVDPSKTHFNVLYLQRLRDYIESDFLPLEPKMKFKFDLEAIIDDWILICFLVGNDFIPHIPHLHIHKGALPKIFDVYQETLPSLNGYMNEKGVLNLKRFKEFTKALAELDKENYMLLIKESCDKCAKDDFSKLNEFVKRKAIVNIRSNRTANSNGNSYNNQRKNFSLPPKAPMHHSNNHQPDVWYNIQQRKSRQHQQQNNMSSTPQKLNSSPQKQSTFPHHHQQQQQQQHQNNRQGGTYGARPHYNMSNGYQRYSDHRNGGGGGGGGGSIERNIVSRVNRGNESGGGSRGGGGGGGVGARRVGVHSFTEEQINKSITVCADGDFVDLQDDGDFQAYKRTYYREKLKLKPDKRSILKVVHEYVRALQWNLHYYYHGCRSWGWFYPYHYAPFISDVASFTDVNTTFEMGEPFKPFDQLLSVLPAASCSLLPTMYRSLVTSESSPLAEYFPDEVEYDLNGKQNDWEAVVLAPFIDEEKLLKASVLCNLFLNQEERSNNCHGPHLLYYRTGPPLIKGHRGAGMTSRGTVKCVEIGLNGFLVPVEKVKHGLLKNIDDNSQDQPNKNFVRNGFNKVQGTNNNNSCNKNHYIANNHYSHNYNHNHNNIRNNNISNNNTRRKK